jgi:Recombination endonuclease VII
MTAQADRERRLLRKYGLTLQQWHAILRAQHNKCATCGKDFNDSTRLPNVDHRHSDGLVRGALCFYCNNDIGEHHDNQLWYCSVADYLINPPAVLTVGRVYVPGSPGSEGFHNA